MRFPRCAPGEQAAPPTPPFTSTPDGEFARQALHVASFSALAIAQPLFDLLRRNSEFLLAHRAGGRELVAFSVLVVVLVPAPAIVLAGLAGWAGRPARRLIVGMTLFVLFALLALQVLEPLTSWTAPWTIGVALVAALVASVGYWRTRWVPVYASLFGVMLAIAPGLFLFDRTVASFWLPQRDQWPAAPPPSVSAPVVVVVFDQFPLVSLLDAGGNIDATLFPSLAQLARESTWYREATAVADRTGHALPAILTGRYPAPQRLPRTADHPDNLFTWLGQRYDLHVVEPLTSICPSSLCSASLSSSIDGTLAMASDAAALYMHLVAPKDLERLLPPIDQNWRDFRVPLWLQRWSEQRRRDRRTTFLDFVRGIEPGGSKPTIHFAHVLLPHEPFVYYPSGRRFSPLDEAVLGLMPGERWTNDPWPVAQTYQRHLMQVRMVDGLVGMLVDRLKEIGLYDRALVVITSDHGASFRPGSSFKTPTDRTFADVMSVPLLVKAPGQRTGRVDDRPVATIDVMPTMADLLGAPLPWKTDGRSALGDIRRGEKRICHRGCRQWVVRTTAQVAEGRAAGVAAKLRVFGSPPDLERPAGLSAAARMIGRRVDSIPKRGGRGITLFLDAPVADADFSRADGYVPGLISGYATTKVESRRAPEVAIAVDGVVRAVSRLVAPGGYRAPVWSALLPERLLAEGIDEIEAFEVTGDGNGGFELRDTGARASRESPANLLNGVVQNQLRIKAIGFHSIELLEGQGPFRWTGPLARLEVPVDSARPPRELSVGICQTGRPGRSLTIRFNDCQLYAGPVPGNPWRRTFPVEACLDGRATATIELRADPFVPGGSDRRRLGVAIDNIGLTY